MASNADGSVTLDFSIDTDGLSKEIDNMNKSVEKFTKNTQNSMKATDKAISEAVKAAKDFKIEPSAEGIDDAVRELDRLNAEIEISERQYAEYEKELERASKKYGENSSQALRLQKSMLSLESSIAKNQKKSEAYADAISKVEDVLESGGKAAEKFKDGLNDTGDAAEKSGDSIKETEKTIGSFQVALGNLISRAIEKAVTSLLDLANSTRELRKEMAALETNARASGVSLEVAEQAMKDLNIVADGTDSALEATSNLLASGFDENGLADAVNVLSGAVIKFPDTMKIESLADGLQETLKTKEATGQYAELLGRLGVNLESYNDTIADMTEAEAREYSLQILRSRGLDKLTEQYKANNEELVDAANAQWDLNQAMADIGEALEPLQTEIMQEITRLITENKDAIISLAENLAALAEMIFGIISVLGSIPAPVWAVIGSIVTLVSAFLTIHKTVQEVSDKFGFLGKGLSAFDTKALKTTAIIFGVLAALIVLAAVIAVITGKTNDLDLAMSSVGNSVGKIQDNINTAQNGGRVRGHARGTESARRGWSWVGERGPELMYLGGGEKILTASQSLAMSAMTSRGAGHSYSQTINISVNGIGQLDEIVKWFTTRRQMERAR